MGIGKSKPISTPIVEKVKQVITNNKTVVSSKHPSNSAESPVPLQYETQSQTFRKNLLEESNAPMDPELLKEISKWSFIKTKSNDKTGNSFEEMASIQETASYIRQQENLRYIKNEMSTDVKVPGRLRSSHFTKFYEINDSKLLSKDFEINEKTISNILKFTSSPIMTKKQSNDKIFKKR